MRCLGVGLLWPWLGVTGAAVNLLLAEANDLETQAGAYIHTVVAGGPAEAAGLRGSTGLATVHGVSIPVGGDVIVAINGEPVDDFSVLLVAVAFSAPGETLDLTVLREGAQVQIPVTLAPRRATSAGPYAQPDISPHPAGGFVLE
ncbi:MAG: PDZ domain-containing protein [Anaerolineales bacterium]|nr:PDZ domain-containing protein [Anaerolineales bacterium]